MWLTATERRIAVHPMTTLPYLFARLIRGNAEGFDDEMKAEIERLRVRYQRIFHVSDATGESLLFRVGCGDVECARSLRRPVDEILVADSPSISL